jgi:hypothetical protein
MASKTPKISFKAGDDFILDFTLTDTNHTSAIEAKAVQDAAEKTLADLKEAEPLDAQAISDATTALLAAQQAYDASILMDITGWGIASQIRWGTNLIDDFEIDMTDVATGKFVLKCAAEKTALWKPKEYVVDIQFTRVSGKISSQTFIVDVERDVTNA